MNNTILFDPNESTVLNCIASGGPNNTFEWFIDGDLIENASDTLTLNEVVGGEYTCRVSNAAGTGNASTTLTGLINLNYLVLFRGNESPVSAYMSITPLPL